MRARTKFKLWLMGLGAAGFAYWGYNHLGGRERVLRAGRTPPAGFVSTVNVFVDGLPGVAYRYAPRQFEGRTVTPTFFVPNDPSKLGVWSFPA